MKQELRQAYISRISTELTNLVNGPKFEQFGYIIADHVYSDYELVHRGTNISGAPVGYVVDTFSNCGKVVCEYSSDEKFFLNFSKINNDIQHALTHHKNSLESIFLLSNRLCKPINQKKLTTIISDTKKNLGVDVKIWDSRTISEYIVDEILLEESTVERLINFLPCIQTIRNESILNLTLPKVDSSYQPRKDLETEIITKLLAGNSLAITGFGGTGKSSFASSISHSIKENFDIPLWLDASEITDIEHLGHYDVYRNGHKVNVLGLLQSKKILLILDDLSAPVSITHLASLCKNGSVIIVTRKNSFDDDDWEIPPLDAAAVKNILDHNTETACPDKIFKKVYNTVGGHPLIYSLMNANIRSKYYNWEDIESDCEAISEYEDDRNQKLTVRLIGHIVGRLETQLSFLKSCNSKVIDLGFAKYAIKPIGVKKLIKSTILTMSGSGFLKIHDIIFEALTNITIAQTDISPILNDYLKNTEADQWSAFLRVSHRHRDAIYKRYKTQGESIYLYSHLISSTPAHLLKNEITK